MKRKGIAVLGCALMLSMSLTGVSAVQAESEVREGIAVGSSMSYAYLAPLNTKVFGAALAKGANGWIAFTTSGTEGAEYRITTVNMTLGAAVLNVSLMDEYGTLVADGVKASDNGAPNTMTVSGLEVNTTYYVRVLHENNMSDSDLAEYSVVVKTQAEASDAYGTADNIYHSGAVTIEDGAWLEKNANINDAVLIPYDIRVHGTVNKGENAWISFTTGDNPDATYNMTTVNDTPGAAQLSIFAMDEYGTALADSVPAHDDGVPKTITVTGLDVNTTYYVRIHHENNMSDSNVANYTFFVKSPDAWLTEEVEETEEVVFEEPFEINDTQIQFKAESSEFIDRDSAIAVLAPVAEAILAHPDNRILIAGTTATDGSQEARVVLSESRAAAVKTVLIDEYGVSEAQIETIGLGFEADPFERGRDRAVEGDITSDFIESEGRKNRRVVIMDYDSAIAQEILAANT